MNFFESRIDKKTYKGSFITVLTGIGGKFEIIRELLKIDGILTLEKEGEWLTIKHDEKYLSNVWEEIKGEKVLAKLLPFLLAFSEEELESKDHLVLIEKSKDLLKSKKTEKIEEFTEKIIEQKNKI